MEKPDTQEEEEEEEEDGGGVSYHKLAWLVCLLHTHTHHQSTLFHMSEVICLIIILVRPFEYDGVGDPGNKSMNSYLYI